MRSNIKPIHHSNSNSELIDAARAEEPVLLDVSQSTVSQSTVAQDGFNAELHSGQQNARNQNSAKQKLRVLIVDDSPEDAELIVRALRRSGYEVISQRVDTRHAMSAALRQPPAGVESWDVVLTDHSMPHFNSIEVLQVLQRHCTDVPCIIVSGAIGEEAAVAAMRAGMRDYIPKHHLPRLGPAIARELEEVTSHRAGRRAAMALQESEERYRTLTENAFDLISETDHNGLYTYASPNHRQALGYAPEEIIGTSLFDQLHAEESAAVQSAFNTALASQQGARIEFRHRHKGGEWRWFEHTIRAMRMANGAGRVVMISRDTTERKRHENEMATLVSLAKAINAQHGLPAILDELAEHLKPLIPFDGLGIWLNEMDELHLIAGSVGRDAADVIPARLARRALPEHPVWAALDDKKLVLVEQRLLPRGSNSMAGVLLGVPLVAEAHTIGLLHFDAAAPGAFGQEHLRLASMVGEQVAVAIREAQLLSQANRAEEQFRTLVNTVEAIVWEADAGSFAFTFVSPQAEQWLGYPLDQWLGDPNFWTERIHPEDREWAKHECLSSTVAGEDHQLEYRVVAADGRVLWLRDLVSVETQDGVPTRVRGIMFDITQRKATEDKLRLRDRAMEASKTGIIITDASQSAHPIIYVNPAFEAMTGYRAEEVLGQHCGFLQGPDTDPEAVGQVVNALRSRTDCRVMLKIHRKDGAPLWNELYLSPVREISPVREPSAGGRPDANPVTHFIWIQTDITERRQAVEALQQSNAILEATQEAAADGICVVDDNGKVVSFNRRFAQLWDVPPEEFAQLRDSRQLMAQVLSKLTDPDEFAEKMNFLYENPDTSSRDEITLLDGRIFERHSAPARSAQNDSYGRVWSFSDITERKQYEQQLAHQAFHDPVTRLPNRALLMERLKLSLARAERSHKSVAVLFLDLDHFKVVNDSLGHEKGDHLLIEVGRRIQACLRPGDTAARFGGDEFAILLEDVVGVKDATLVASRIEQSLQAPFELDGREVEVAASVGIVLSSRGQDRAEDLLRKADVAMYRAKNNGRAQYEVFDTKVSALALERLEMEIDLRQSIKRRQLRLYYQPLVDLATGYIVGLEALLRWQHPTRGLVPPFEFIPLADDTRMVLPIGHWVLREACSQARRWQQEFPRQTPLEVSINLSSRQFQDPQLAPDIARVLRESGLAAQCLELEIIESTVMEDAQTTVTQLETLKELGVQLAVDDFGTGYSSLSYLERFPLDTLKIDRAFVSRINEETDTGPASGGAVVRAVCTLGHALDMRVTAEGIETAAQLQHLRRIGCHVGQGYLFAPPLPAEEITALLRKNPRW